MAFSINDFPPETLSHIFNFCLNIPDVCPDIYQAPFTLGLVCQLWREVVYQTPQLWSCISLVMTKEGPQNQERLGITAWLERSATCPLTVTLRRNCALEDGDGWKEHTAVDLLVPHCQRLHELIIYADPEVAGLVFEKAISKGNDISNLKFLTFKPSMHVSARSVRDVDLDLSHVPLLVGAELTGSYSLSYGHASFTSLRTAKFCFRGSFNLFPYLQLFPLLEELSVTDSTEWESQHQSPPTTTLPTLSTLRLVTTVSAAINALLDSLLVPALTKLMIESSHGEALSWNHIGEMIQRSGACIKHLHIDSSVGSNMVDSLDQIHCLTLCPSLDSLSVLSSSDYTLSSLTYPLDSSEPHDILPHLRCLSLECESTTPFDVLRNMVLSRWGGPSGHSRNGCLKRLVLSFPPTVWFSSITELQWLDQCAKEGLKVWKKRRSGYLEPQSMVFFEI